MIEIKKKPKKLAAKKPTKKAAISKAAKKKPIKDLEIDELDDLQMDKDLEALFGEQLDDEAKRAMIRARVAQAKKQERLNDVARSHLVDREQAGEEIKRLALALSEQLTNMPDELVNQLHKRTKKEIRDKLVKKVDQMKKEFIKVISK